MFTHLLVPMDCSESAEAALKVGIELAQKFNSRVTLLHVLVNIPHASIIEAESHDNLLDSVRRTAYERAVSYLEGKEAYIRSQGITYVDHHIVESSSPADAILSAGEKLACDAMVMSTHGRTGLNRWVFGSVAERVVRASTIPIVLIRAHNEQNS